MLYQQSQANSGYLRLPQILEIFPIGKSTWWKWVADNKAPKPIRLGPKTTAWRCEDIHNFIKEINENGGLK